MIDSLFVFADVHDVITARPAPVLGLELEGPFADAVPAGADNLVLRAARALAAYGAGAGAPPGAAITLRKTLPPASGMGGGSSDAAATLRVLRRLWRLEIPDAGLMAVAGQLGADVPACLAGGVLQVSGIGEAILPLAAVPDAHMVLANPGVALSTAQVFAAYDRAGEGYSAPAPMAAPPGEFWDPGELAAALGRRRNDLEAAARGLDPGVGGVLAALRALPGCLLARMSGSGGTCFAMFATAGEAQAGAQILGASHPGWWVAAARLLAAPPRLEVRET